MISMASDMIRRDRRDLPGGFRPVQKVCPNSRPIGRALPGETSNLV